MISAHRHLDNHHKERCCWSQKYFHSKKHQNPFKNTRKPRPNIYILMKSSSQTSLFRAQCTWEGAKTPARKPAATPMADLRETSSDDIRRLGTHDRVCFFARSPGRVEGLKAKAQPRRASTQRCKIALDIFRVYFDPGGLPNCRTYNLLSMHFTDFGRCV